MIPAHKNINNPPGQIVNRPELCACKLRYSNQCDEEWGPQCDLGNNEKYAVVMEEDKLLSDYIERKQK